MGQSALVLGAGGPAASAWEIGIITGMADAGTQVRNSDLIVGTSAGAQVGAQISNDMTLEELFQRQLDPALQMVEQAPPADFTRLRGDLLRVRAELTDPIAVLKRYGELALRVPADLQEARRSMIAARLSSHAWPELRLSIVAVDVESGERRAFERSAGVDLLDALAASGAVPGIWPVVPIGRRRYMDGGTYSIDNADLAMGCDRVLILTLPARVPSLCVSSLESAVTRLRNSGAEVGVVQPDDASQAAFASVGGNLLDPSVRPAAARAGREQGLRFASAKAGRWESGGRE